MSRRIVRHLGSGKVIDDCVPDNEADERLFRRIEPGTHYRVELVTKNASKWFHRIGPDVAEIYSPPRVTNIADKIGLTPGFAFDLTTVDPTDGKAWDFNDPVKRERERAIHKQFIH